MKSRAVLAVAAALLAGDGPARADGARTSPALTHLRAEAPGLTTVWPAGRKRPTMIRGIALHRPGRSLQARAIALLDELRPLVLGEDGQESAAVTGRRTTHSRRVLRLEQRYAGLPVFGRQITVTFDRQSRVRAIHSDAVPVALAPAARKPRLDAHQATRAAARGAGGRAPSAGARRLLDGLRPRLVILADGGPARLAYAVALPFRLDPRGRIHLVDARTGDYLGWRPGVLFERDMRLEHSGSHRRRAEVRR